MPQNMQRVCHALRTAGLRLREQDVEALSHWIAERVRRLALPGIEQYGQLLSAESTAGRRERELLTGMGSDGAQGMLDIARAGGLTIAQDEESSVVFGMPRRAIELGAAKHVLPLDQIGPALIRAASATSIRLPATGTP